MNLLTKNVAASVARASSSMRGLTDVTEEQQQEMLGPITVWIVFAFCLACSGAGVFLSFLLLGPRITGVRLWGVGFVISIVMLGISYGAKYANPAARRSFTPIDLIQYLSQGFLWPSTWPALADFLGVQELIPPAQDASWRLVLPQTFF